MIMEVVRTSETILYVAKTQRAVVFHLPAFFDVSWAMQGGAIFSSFWPRTAFPLDSVAEKPLLALFLQTSGKCSL